MWDQWLYKGADSVWWITILSLSPYGFAYPCYCGVVGVWLCIGGVVLITAVDVSINTLSITHALY